jgi:hypothetical protein
LSFELLGVNLIASARSTKSRRVVEEVRQVRDFFIEPQHVPMAPNETLA